MATPSMPVPGSWWPSGNSCNDNTAHVDANLNDGEAEEGDEEHSADLSEDEADDAQSEDDQNVKLDLAAALDSIKGTGGFYAHFTLKSAANPGLEIEGLRRFGMPLSEFDVKAIIAESGRAPYGKGTETLVNEDVRRTFDIDGARVKLRHPQWSTELDKMVTQACNQLGVPGGTKAVEAQLYKLLVYDEGAMFKPHKDSEKVPRMFGTLVVSLPSLHTGGDLHITFGGKTHSLSTSSNSEWSSTCMAWYSDIVHEIKPVTSGYRVVLTYNLVTKGATVPPSLSELADKISELRSILTKWRDMNSPQFFVYPLEHTYTDASICASQLKGTDIQRVQCLTYLQEELGLKLCLASLQKSVLGDCDDWIGACNQWDRDRNGYDPADDFPHRITEEIETTLELAEIFDLKGKVIAGDVQVDEEENLVKSYFHDERDPDDEEFEGNTGNEGATTKHWYKDMALIIVPEEKWIDMALSSVKPYFEHGYSTLAQLLRSEVQKLRADPDKDKAALAKICFAATAVRMCDRIQILLLILDGHSILGIPHAAGQAIQNFVCNTAADTVDLLRRCQTIGQDNLMAGVITRSQYKDWTQCMVVIDCCLSMKRVNLAILVMKRASVLGVEKSVEQAEMLLKSLDEHSHDLTLNDMRECLDTALGWSSNLAVCSRVLSMLATHLERHSPADCDKMRDWMQAFLEKTFNSTVKIVQADFDIMLQLIVEQGTDWFFNSLVPLAIEKSRKGNFSFSTSLIDIIMRTPELADSLGPRALSALTPLLLTGINFNGPKLHVTTAVRNSWVPSGLDLRMALNLYSPLSMSPAHQVTHLSRSCEDMLSSAEIVQIRSALIDCKLTAEQSQLEEKLIEECKGMSQSNVPFLHELLAELAKPTKQQDSFTSKDSTWFRDLVAAFVVRVVGFEPAPPEHWRPTQRRGCGCTDCSKLDKFILDPKQKETTFNLANLPAATHIEERVFRGLPAIDSTSSGAQYSTRISKYGYKRNLNIIKNHGDFDLEHSQWTGRAASMRKSLSALGSPDRLQALLGPCYQDIVQLEIISLQRLPSGVTIASKYQAPMPIPGVKRSALLSGDTVDTESRSSDLGVSGDNNAAGTKRKLPIDATDNTEPAKKCSLGLGPHVVE